MGDPPALIVGKYILGQNKAASEFRNRIHRSFRVRGLRISTQAGEIGLDWI